MPNSSDDLFRMMIPHLASQFERAQPILFTGAGFSLGARNIAGNPLPTSADLRAALWNICFPGEADDDGSSLQDLYAQAQLRHARQLKDTLTRFLSVDPDSLPDYYAEILSMPWYRTYTLNIDDLESATSRKFELPRRVASVSATAPSALGASGVDLIENLEVVHLNGTIGDIPDHVTFSPTQYGERLARHEPWYAAVVANLLSHPIVFIGTRLDEPPLWQHLELRRMRGGRGMQELRPRSYLVVPQLEKARQALLSEFNVFWVPMDAEQFSNRVLTELRDSARIGLQRLGAARRSGAASSITLPEVSELAQDPMQGSEFLIGHEPIWADIQSGRAITRENDELIWQEAKAKLAQSEKGFLAITGTAGSGKSTALMRLCLRLTAEGTRVAWIDRDSDLSPREIRIAMKAQDGPSILAMDDADIYGGELASLLREIATFDRKPLILIAVRSGKIDRVLSSTLIDGIPHRELAIPHLTDADIGALIDVLDRENRLGILKGLPRSQQESAFRQQAGRQLLVAMIQATSGPPLKEKVVSELSDLNMEGRYVYSLIAVASSFRFKLSRDELLTASGDRTNAVLNALELLVRRHVITSVSADGSLRARHRVIADLVFDELQRTGELRDVIVGLAFVAATKVDPTQRRSTRPWRMLRSLLNHDFLARTISAPAAREIYAPLEQLLSWDYQYWLQRGSLEVEFGDVALAENFLSQARSLSQDEDPYVTTEWAYLLFTKAQEHPQASGAPELAAEATGLLEDLIERPGANDTYPYHVLGSQGLRWARRGISSVQEKEQYLNKLLGHLRNGCDRFPRLAELEQLRRDLQREVLGLAVPARATLM